MSAFDNYKKIRGGGSLGTFAPRGSSSSIQGNNAQSLYNSYAKEIEDEEDENKSPFQRYAESRNGMPSYQQVQEDAMQANIARYEEQREQRSKMLPELEKIKTGEADPTAVKEAKNRLASLGADDKTLFDQYVNPVVNYDGNNRFKFTQEEIDLGMTAEDAVKDRAWKSLLDKGYNKKEIDNIANAYRTISDYDEGKAMGKKDGFLTAEEELIYNQASIEALSKGEREAMSLIHKGQKQEADESSYGFLHTGLQAEAFKWLYRKTGANPEAGDGANYIKEGQQILKDKYGWDDDKVKEYTLRSERLANYDWYNEQEGFMPTSKDDSAPEKIAKGAANWAFSRAMSPLNSLSVLSNFEEKPEGQGRDLYSTTNMYRVHSENADQDVVQNYLSGDTKVDDTAVGRFINKYSGQNVGQFLYSASASAGDSMVNMAMAGAAADFLGVAGAGAELASATKNGVEVTKQMRNAAALESMVKNVAMTPFVTSGYESGYRQARLDGASEEGAQLRGICSGMAEYVTEKISLDNAWEIARGTKAGKNIVVNLLAQGAIEGSEEMASDLINDVADQVISHALNDKLSDFDERVEAYMKNGMSEEDAQSKALKEKVGEYLSDGLAGSISGLGMGSAASIQGYQTANYNTHRANYISEQSGKIAENANTDTEYGQSVKENAEKYKNVPTQYLADHIDDSTEEGREAKKKIQEYADKEAAGKKLTALERLDIEESLYVAEQAVEKFGDSRSAYENYKKEVASVPDQYRSQESTITVDQAQKQMYDAAKSGDLKKISDTYQAMKNSTSAQMRSQADEIYQEAYGLAENNGVAKEQLDALKISPQDAYIRGMNGETREDLGAISHEAAEAFNAGQQQRMEIGKKVVESAKSLKGSVQTNSGAVKLSGSFDAEGKVITDKGSIEVADIQDTTATKQAYVNASAQKTLNAKNAYIENIKDGVNINQYDIAFRNFYRAGETGVSFEDASKNGFSKIIADTLGKDTMKAIFDAGVSDYAVQVEKEAAANVNKAFKVKKGSGSFQDVRRNPSVELNTDFMRLVAKATGLDVVLTDSNESGKQAQIELSKSKITVTEDHAAQLVHELAEFTEFYNSAEYEKIRSAAMQASAKVLGADGYQQSLDNYQKAYERINSKQTALESSREMTNDFLVALMNTSEGQKALADYMCEQYGVKEAKSLGTKIKDFFKGIIDSMKNLWGNSSLNNYQKQILQGKIDDSQKIIDSFVKALDGAVKNYEKTAESRKGETLKVRNSLTVDNTGKELSEGQKEFFADAKTVDKKGALKVFHHGTASYGFDVFDIKKAKSSGQYGRGFYFSDSESHAGQYGNTYDVYLNIVNPVQTGVKTFKDEDILKYIEAIANDEDYGIDNYGYDATPQSVLKMIKGKDDFGILNDLNATCIGDFCAAVKLWNEVNGTSYDGIMAPTETIAFYSNQIKETDNLNPTSDPSIKFSMKVDPKAFKQLEEAAVKDPRVDFGKNLIAVHNMTVDQLMADIDLKGLPSPSIAIIKAGMEHSKYGDVSILFRRSTIDPKVNKQNKVYGGDAWTPTFPTVEVKLSEKAVEAINEKINKLVPDNIESTLQRLALDEDNMTDKINRNNGNAVDAYEHNDTMKYAFLRDMGVEITPAQKEAKLARGYNWSNDAILAIDKAIGHEIFEEFKQGGYQWLKDHPEFEEQVRKIANDQFREKYAKSAKDSALFKKDLYDKDNFGFNDLDAIARGISKYHREGITMEPDTESVRSIVTENMEGREEEYHKWLEDLFKDVIEKKGLRNNRGVFTNSGNRRSWEVLHDDFTLENIVRIMNQNDEKGADGFFAQSAIQALATKDFKSIEDIQANKDMLKVISEEEHDAVTQAHSQRFTEICSEIMDKTEHNQFTAFDRAAEAIKDAVSTSKTKAGIDKVLREYRNLHITEHTAQDILDLMKDISELPTGYFEAKPRRAVWLSEIAEVLLPSDVSNEVITKLSDAGVPWKLYYAGNEYQRAKMLADESAELNDVRFSLDTDEDRIFYAGNVEVVKNPTNKEYQQMRDDILKERPWLRGTGEPLLRHTYDEEGNTYYWDVLGGLHSRIEPQINKHYNTRTSQQWEWWKREDKDDYPVDWDARYSLDVRSEDQPTKSEWASFYKAVANYNNGNGIETYTTTKDGDVIIPVSKGKMSEVDNKLFITDANIENPKVNGMISINAEDGSEAAYITSLIEGEIKDGKEIREACETCELFGGEGILNFYNFKSGKKTHGKYDGASERRNVSYHFEDDSELQDGERGSGNTGGSRYSLTVDSEGRSLSTNQQEYFKDSKMRDENGSLKVMYHGARGAGFTVFNPGRSDDNHSLFFTDDLAVAKTYSGTHELFLPDKQMSYAELDSAMQGYTSGEQYLKQDGKDVVVMEVGMDEDQEVYRGSLKGAQDFFVDSIQDIYHDTDANYQVYLNITNPLVVDAMGNRWDELPEGAWDKHYGDVDIMNASGEYGYEADWQDIDTGMWQHEGFRSLEEMEKKFGRIYEIDELNNIGELFINDIYVDKNGKRIPTNTRLYADMALEQGYDGVIFNNMIDAGLYASTSEETPSTVAVAFNSNQIKSVDNMNPTMDPDIRFSMGIDDGFFSLMEGFYDDDARDIGSILEDGMKALKNQEVDVKAINTIATKLRSEYGSTINVKTFSDMMQKAFAYMQTADHVNYADMMRVFNEIARPVIDEATHTEGEEVYRNFVNALKKYKIKLNPGQMAEVKSAVGSYADFKKAMSPLNFSLNGTYLDSIWSEMVEASGYVLDMDISDAEEPLALYDALSALKPTPVNDYGGDAEDVAKDLAMRIVEEYLGAQSDARAKKAVEKIKAKQTEYRSKVREQYRERYNKAREQMAHQVKEAKYNERWHSAETRAKYDEKVLQIKARNKKAATDLRKAQQARHEKQMISKEAKKLMKWILEPNDKNHVPTPLQEPLIEFFNALDFVEPEVKQDAHGNYYIINYKQYVTDNAGNRKFGRFVGSTKEDVLNQYNKAAYRGEASREANAWTEKMRQMQDILKAARDCTGSENADMHNFLQLVDPELADQFDDMLSRNRGVANINTLDPSDFKIVKNTLRGISHWIANQNRAFTSGANIEEQARDAIENAKKNKPKDHTRIMNSITKLLQIDMCNPETFFAFQGEQCKDIFNSFNAAFERKVSDIKQSSEFMEEVMKDVKKSALKKWTGENAELHTFHVSGGRLDLTTAHIMSLYELAKRPQALQHIVIGGIETDTVNKRKGIFKVQHAQNEGVHVTADELNMITGSLTEQQKEIADKIQQFMANECSVWGNEASEMMYNYKKFGEKEYFPIKTDADTHALNNANAVGDLLNAIEHMGFTKQVTPNADNALVLTDIFDVLSEHVNQMAAYHAYAPAVKDAIRWFNYKFRTESDGGVIDQTAVQKAINANMGRSVDKAGSEYFKKFIRDINGQEKNNDIQTPWQALIGNYKGAAIGGNLRVVIQQPTAYIRAANMVSPKYLIAATPKLFVASHEMKRIKDLSPTAYWKSQGYYETAMGKSLKEIITGISTPRDKMVEYSIWLAGKADDITWACLYNAVEMEQRKATKGQNLTRDEFTARVNERFRDVIAQTQVVDATIQKSQAMRASGVYSKMITSFMAEPTKSYNMAMKAMVNDYREHGGNFLKWKSARKALVVLGITDLVNSLAQSLMDAIRYHDDDEEYYETLLKYFESNMLDNVNPLNRLPGVKDVSSALINAIKGENTYGSSMGQMLDASAVQSMIDIVTTTKKLIDGEYKKTAYAATMTYAKEFSNLTGVPIYNILREGSSFLNLFADDEHQLRKQVEKKNDKYQSFYNALDAEKSDEDLQNAIQKAMGKGGTVEDIKSGIGSKYKEAYMEAFEAGDQETMNDLRAIMLRGYKAAGYNDDDMNNLIDSWTSDKVSYSILDDAIENGGDVRAAIKALQEGGKEDDKIVEHILSHYEHSVDYERSNYSEGNIEEQVESALSVFGTNYNRAQEDARIKAEEKAAKQEATEKKKAAKQATYDIFESGSGDYQAAITDWYNAGVDPSDIKSDITADLTKPLVKAYKQGDTSVTTKLNRIALMRAYIDEQCGTNISERYGGDYYQYEIDQITKKMDEYDKEPW